MLVVDLEVSSVHSDDISDSVNEWEILELVGIDNNLSPVVFLLWVESWVNDLHGADEGWLSGLQDLLEWERGIDDDGVEVALLGRGEGGLGELNVVVLNDSIRLGYSLLTLFEDLAGDLDFGIAFLTDFLDSVGFF